MTPKNEPGMDMEKVLAGEAPLRITDPAEAAAAIVTRILSAETVDDVLTMQGTMGAEQMLDRPFSLHSVEFRKSDFEQGAPVYTLMRGVDPATGETLVVTCGGSNVNAQCVKLAQLGAVNQDPNAPAPDDALVVKLVKAPRPTAAGFYPLWLQRAA